MKLSYRIFTAVAAMAAAGAAMAAVPVTVFPQSSVLATGKWVQVNAGKTGIYEISYDQLRAMGFADPTKVSLYGRAATEQPANFANAQGTPLYQSDLQPLSIEHTGSKIIFWNQAMEDIRYQAPTDSTSTGSFRRETLNVYTSSPAYFLTDSKPVVSVKPASTSYTPSQLPAYDKALSFFYHEKEVRNYISSGREYFGENFTAAADRTQSVPYALPGTEAGDTVALTCRFVGKSANGGTVTFQLEPGQSQTATLAKPATLDYYHYSAPETTLFTLPASTGELSLTYTPSGNVTFAALDYFILSGRRALRLQPGETQMAVVPADYDPATMGNIVVSDATDGLRAWTVTASGAVQSLPGYAASGEARFSGLAKGFDGRLVFFDPASDQLQIEGYEEVANQNLHALGIQKTPTMLIVTLPHLQRAAEALAQLHRDKDGIEVQVVLSDDVVREFSAGNPDPMAYRALAKMLYDRDPSPGRTFKHILLFGPCVRDHRNIYGIVPNGGTLICNESPSSQFGDNTWCMLDWYGMLEDYSQHDIYSLYPYMCPMQVSVGVLPVKTELDGFNMVEKAARSYTDTSYAYWLNSFNYLTDGTDKNEHQEWGEYLWNDMSYYTGRAIEGNKLYNNLYNQGGTREMLKERLASGSILSVYTGHADSSALNSESWKKGDEQHLNNNRYGFMGFAACTTAPFDSNVRGVAEALIMTPGKGLLGGVVTTRSCYSSWNYWLMEFLQRPILLENYDASYKNERKLVSSKRTLGDIYVKCKNQFNAHQNKFAYHLMADPALYLPFPTAAVTGTVNGTASTQLDPVSVYPHSQIAVEGTVANRKGALKSDFNGTVVAKVYSPTATRKSSTRLGSPATDVEVDEAPLLVTAFDVKDGRYSGTILLPSDLLPSADEDNTAVIRLAAYDPATRTGAAGAIPVLVKDYDAMHAVTTDAAPVIEALYADSADGLDTDLLPPAFTLHADITDDYGVCTTSVAGISTLFMTIDSKLAVTNLHENIEIAEGGRRVHLSYPLAGFTDGLHTITLTATDAAGQVSTRTVTVNVGARASEQTLALAEPGPCRTSAAITVSGGSGAQTQLVIRDAQGRTLRTAPVSGTGYEWDLTDARGARVPAGLYTAVARSTEPGRPASVSAPLELIVF